jgi:hypothetical protein
MQTRSVRYAMAMAMLWIGFGVGGRAEAGGIALSTPTGLSPGESFRFVFLTDGTTNANSPNIADYNSFVNAQAGGATFNGSVVLWVAIASTPTVNAIDNIGQTPISGVYLADGTLVTPSTTSSGMWSGGILNPINEDLSGTKSEGTPVWTGTYIYGLGNPGYQLGTETPVYGISASSNSPAWVNEQLAGASATFSMYGISQVLYAVSAVPEPSTLLMAGMAISAGCALGWSRRRRDQRRRGSLGQPDATG